MTFRKENKRNKSRNNLDEQQSRQNTEKSSDCESSLTQTELV